MNTIANTMRDIPVTDKITPIVASDKKPTVSRQKFRKSTGQPVLPANTTPLAHLTTTVARMNKISGLGYVVVAAITLCRNAEMSDSEMLAAIEAGVK